MLLHVAFVTEGQPARRVRRGSAFVHGAGGGGGAFAGCFAAVFVREGKGFLERKKRKEDLARCAFGDRSGGGRDARFATRRTPTCPVPLPARLSSHQFKHARVFWSCVLFQLETNAGSSGRGWAGGAEATKTECDSERREKYGYRRVQRRQVVARETRGDACCVWNDDDPATKSKIGILFVECKLSHLHYR